MSQYYSHLPRQGGRNYSVRSKVGLGRKSLALTFAPLLQIQDLYLLFWAKYAKKQWVMVKKCTMTLYILHIVYCIYCILHIVYIAYCSEMNLRICNYAQKRHDKELETFLSPPKACQLLPPSKIKKEKNRCRQKHIAIFEVFMLCYKILTKGNSK